MSLHQPIHSNTHTIIPVLSHTDTLTHSNNCSWYWESLDADVRAMLQGALDATDPAAHSRWPSGRTWSPPAAGGAGRGGSGCTAAAGDYSIGGCLLPKWAEDEAAAALLAAAAGMLPGHRSSWGAASAAAATVTAAVADGVAAAVAVDMGANESRRRQQQQVRLASELGSPPLGFRVEMPISGGWRLHSSGGGGAAAGTPPTPAPAGGLAWARARASSMGGRERGALSGGTGEGCESADGGRDGGGAATAGSRHARRAAGSPSAAGGGGTCAENAAVAGSPPAPGLRVSCGGGGSILERLEVLNQRLGRVGGGSASGSSGGGGGGGGGGGLHRKMPVTG